MLPPLSYTNVWSISKVYSEPDHFFPLPLLSPWSCPLLWPACTITTASSVVFALPTVCFSYAASGTLNTYIRVHFSPVQYPLVALSHTGIASVLSMAFARPCMIQPCYLSTCSFYPAHSAPATLASGPLHLFPLPGTLVETHVHLLLGLYSDIIFSLRTSLATVLELYN